jgi:hypothetical protein
VGDNNYQLGFLYVLEFVGVLFNLAVMGTEMFSLTLSSILSPCSIICLLHTMVTLASWVFSLI